MTHDIWEIVRFQRRRRSFVASKGASERVGLSLAQGFLCTSTSSPPSPSSSFSAAETAVAKSSKNEWTNERLLIILPGIRVVSTWIWGVVPGNLVVTSRIWHDFLPETVVVYCKWHLLNWWFLLWFHKFGLMRANVACTHNHFCHKWSKWICSGCRKEKRIYCSVQTISDKWHIWSSCAAEIARRRAVVWPMSDSDLLLELIIIIHDPFEQGTDKCS